jgi:hypothetical protein
MEEERNNRTVWIIVVVVLAVVGICCCLLAAAAAGGVLFVAPLATDQSDMGWDVGEGKRAWRHYEVGDSPVLTIDNFAGSISVRAAEKPGIEIVAHKQARRKSDLDKIKVDINRTRDGLDITTKKPPGLSNAWVQFEILAPAGTRLDASTGAGSMRIDGIAGGVKAHSGSGGLVIVDAQGGLNAHTGSGSIEVRGASGGTRVDSGSGSLRLDLVRDELRAETGSGSIQVQDASGPVHLQSGSGSLSYAGSPQGDSRFQTGSGGITLLLPADLDMTLDLHTGSGRVEVSHELTGPVTASKGEVRGQAGSGEDGSIWARTGSGNIRVTSP